MAKRDPIPGQIVISKGTGQLVRVRRWAARDGETAFFDGTAVGRNDHTLPTRFWWRADFVKQQFRELTDNEFLKIRHLP